MVETVFYTRPKLLQNLTQNWNSHFTQDQKIQKDLGSLRVMLGSGYVRCQDRLGWVEMEVSYQYLNCVSMHSGWLDPWTSSISYILYMEYISYHLGQEMTLCRMTAPLEILSGLNHCQKIWLVLQIILGNFYKSCLHFSALLVVTSKVLCRIQLFLLKLDLDQQIIFHYFWSYWPASAQISLLLIW
jgi:hypothetical protein